MRSCLEAYENIWWGCKAGRQLAMGPGPVLLRLSRRWLNFRPSVSQPQMLHLAFLDITSYSWVTWVSVLGSNWALSVNEFSLCVQGTKSWFQDRQKKMFASFLSWDKAQSKCLKQGMLSSHLACCSEAVSRMRMLCAACEDKSMRPKNTTLRVSSSADLVTQQVGCW